MSGDEHDAPSGTFRRSRYHHGDLRRALVAAAMEILDAHGADAVTVRAAARAAGVSAAAPYRHFDGKAGLLSAVAVEGFRSLASEVRRAGASVTQHGDARRAIEAMGRAYVGYAARFPDRFRLMFRGGHGGDPVRQALRAAREEAFGLLVAGIRASQASGTTRKGDAEALALTSWVAVHGLAQLAVDGQFEDYSLTLEEITARVTASVLSDPPPS